jgi:DNA-directed RNA polymerase subunit H (RpoH/RPB5)
MEQLFEKYKNIQLFAINYRKFKLLDKGFMSYSDFKTDIQRYEYVLHKFKNHKNQNVDLYLFKDESKFITSTINFKKILDRYNGDHIIILITKEELNIYRRKSIKQYPQLNIKNYLHKHFLIEMNKGPLCSVHTILTPDEVRDFCNGILAHGHSLPALIENDPQAIWIGAEINDVVRIDCNSEITGKTIRYRIVTPSSGKVMQSSGAAITKDPNEEDDDNDVVNPDKKGDKEKLKKIKDEELDEEDEFVDDFID